MSDDFDTDFASLKDYAREYHKHGLTPVPCKFPKNSQDEKSWKHPPVPWKKEQYAQIDINKLEEWFSNPNHKNIGLLTGAASNGVFVVDLDLYKDKTGEAAGWWQESVDLQESAGEIEDTWIATSASGGKHYYYKMPDGWRAPQDTTEQNVDFRGQGGFIICPPSVNHLGQSYKWVDGHAPWDRECAVAPMWFCKRIDDYMAVCLKNKPRLKTDRTYSQGSYTYEEDPFTGEITYKDGREKNCTGWSWAGAMELRAKFINGGYPSDAEIKEAFLHSYNIYLKKNFPKDEERKAYPDLTDEEILETVGRGLTAYSVRFNNAIAKWDDELLEAAKNPRKKDQKEFSSQGPFVVNSIEQPPPNPTRFTVLNYQDIMSMPDPVYMVDGLIIENSFTFIAGDPGAGKSFAAMSLMMAVANKKPTWMGRSVKKHGAVIYISTEGNNDMKFRLKAWESEYGRLKEDPPIHLIPDQMNLLVDQDVDDLIATIESKIQEIGQKVELIVFDTVSNNIPGADENLQKDVTLFVRACTKIKIKFQTTVVGVHHLSRNGNGQMRGSTVLDGSADTIMIFEKVKNDKTKVKMTAKKIKSAEDGWHELWGVKKVAIGLNSSLVLTPPIREAPKPSEEPFGGKQQLSKEPDMETCQKMVAAIHAAWAGGYPWSRDAKSRDTDRYAPEKLSDSFGLSVEMCEKYVNMWHRNDVIVTDNWGEKKNKKGLRIGKGL